MIEITMPKGYRYMSQNKDYLLRVLPLDNKFLLNKSIPGCGGTSMFLESDIPIVLISPRVQVLKEKHNYYNHNGLQTFLFYTEFTNAKKREEEISKLMMDLNKYVSESSTPPKILVTLDSASKVLDILENMRWQNKFLYVVDEFQCLMGDARFKGSIDMNFLIQIDKRVKRICYLSATPIPEQYLENIVQFKGISHYKLNWDPEVLVEPIIREIQMKKAESPEKICGNIITDYREKGFFARKLLPDGTIAYSNEICIFLNDVKSITSIINTNGLTPKEVTILCSESRRSDLPSGFVNGDLTINKYNPQNKPFTFCTKASFEGVDFYSTNAITYIFIDGTKEWQTLDILLDIPQILGRQRLDVNPFKHDATIYYRTKPVVEDENEFWKKQGDMMIESQDILAEFQSDPQKRKERTIQLYKDMRPDAKFRDNYIDLINDGNGITLGINSLVQASTLNMWILRNHYYANSFQLLQTIQEGVQMNKRPDEIKEFERLYYNIHHSKQFELYATFRLEHPGLEPFLIQNPFIKPEFHIWFDKLDFNKLKKLKFNEEEVERTYKELLQLNPIIEVCRKEFNVGELYTKLSVKSKLQKIYNNFDLVGKNAKATDLLEYCKVEERWYSDGGKRNKGYVIVG